MDASKDPVPPSVPEAIAPAPGVAVAESTDGGGHTNGSADPEIVPHRAFPNAGERLLRAAAGSSDTPPKDARAPAAQPAIPPTAPGEGPGDEVVHALVDHERLANWLTVTISDEVERRALEREARRERMQTRAFTMIVTAISVIGLVGATGLIRSTIDTQVRAEQAQFVETVLPDKLTIGVNDRVAAALTASTKDLRSEIRSESDFQQFSYLVVMLQGEKDGFTDDHRDNIVALLRRIAGSGVHSGRPEFPVLLEKTIDPFVSADLPERVDDLVDLFPLESRMTRGIVFTLVLHYGARLAGNVSIDGEGLAKLKERFELFEQASQSFHIEELALPYRLLIEFERSGLEPSPKTDALLAATGGLPEPRATAKVIRELARLTHFAFHQRRENEQSYELARLSNALLTKYQVEIGDLLGRPDVGPKFVELSRMFNSDEDVGGALSLASALQANGVPVDPILAALDLEVQAEPDGLEKPEPIEEE